MRGVLLALIIGVAAILRLWGIGFGLPHDFARPDEERIAAAALRVFQGDLNPHFFLYPTLFIYLTAAAYVVQFAVERVVGTTATADGFVAHAVADPARLFLVARELSAVTGILSVAALYGAAREILSRRAALVAAAFLAVAFLHVRDSHFGVTDVPVTLLVVCAFWAAARCATRGVTWPRMAIAGLLCGLAASTKYNAVLVVAPALVPVVRGAHPLRVESAARYAGPVAMLGLCLALGFLIGTPFAVLDRPAFAQELSAQQRIVFGHQHSTIIDAARLVNGDRGWQHHLTFSLRHGVGLPLLVAAVAGACWLVRGQPWLAALILSFPVTFYAAMGSSQLAYARYMVPLVPFLCLTAAALIDGVADRLESVLAGRGVATAVAVTLATLVAAPTAAQSVAFDRLVARTDTRVLGARWIEARFPTGASLFQTGRAYGYLQPRPHDRYPQVAFDERSGVFVAEGRQLSAAPDLVVVLDSPLVIFSEAPEQLVPALDRQFLLAATFTGIATSQPSDAVYDQQDAFYVPFDYFSGVRRPGPTVRIFVRQ